MQKSTSVFAGAAAKSGGLSIHSLAGLSALPLIGATGIAAALFTRAGAEEVWLTGGLLALLGLTAAASLFAVYSTLRAVNGIAESMERIRKGEADVEAPGAGRSDSFGVMARAVSEIGREHAEQGRVRAALDASSAPIMIADADLTITYLNPVLQRMLEKSNEYWAKRAPGFDFKHIVGTKIDIFHKDASKQRGMLARLEGDHTAEISFDERLLGFTATPIRDGNGEKTGFVVQWRDLTDTRAVERQINEVIEALANGKFDRRVEVASDDPFVAGVANGVNRICGIVDGFTAELAQSIDALAEGDLTRQIETAYDGRFGQLAGSVNATVSRLAELVADIQMTAVSIQSATTEISTGASDLSERAESQASSLEETAATMEEITSTIQSNADNAEQARGLSSDAAERAARGGEVVKETTDAMARIEASATKISEIISVIDAIAFQTNLLALNAAVEAARAGDAGKGFAVVASEVRTLAQRSSDAARDIAGLITESGQHVAEGSKLVRRTGDSLDELVGAVGKVADTISGITAASREQAIGIQEISAAVSNMDEATQQNASLAEESAAAAKGLSAQAERLAELVQFFELKQGVKPRAAAQPARSAAPVPIASAAVLAEAQSDEAWANF